METGSETRRERQLAAAKKWRANNKDKMAKAHSEWVKRNPERAKEIQAKSNSKRAAKIREYGKLWREKNRDRNREAKRRYYEENRERIRGEAKKKYASAKEMGIVSGGLFVSLAMASLREHGCVFCGEMDGLELDHKLPRSRGGVDDEVNLQWLCRLCNFAKGNMTTEEFVSHIRKVLKRLDART